MAIFTGRTVDEAIEKGLDELGIPKEKATVQIRQAESKGFLGFGKKLAKVEIKPISEEVIQQADRQAVRGVPDEIRAQADPVKSASEATVELSQVIQAVKQADAEGKGEDFPKSDESPAEKKEEIPVGDQDSLEVAQPVAEASEPDRVEVLENLDEKTTIIELSKYLTKITKKMGAPALVKVNRESNGVILFSLESTKQGILIGKHGKVLNSLQYLSQVFTHRVSEEKISVVINVGDYREKREAVLKKMAKRTAEQVKRTGRPVFLEPMPAYERKKIHAALAQDPYLMTHSEGNDPFRYLVVEKSTKQI
ncbi:MAG: protein jag [Streptococcaceae bacterium]|jgi:spoIIIJ-associated protein|nr:protein jag [Streptococcaceae bacterium]